MRAKLSLAIVLAAAFLIRGFSFFCYDYPTGTDYGHHTFFADQYLEDGRIPATFSHYQLGGSRWSNMPGTAISYGLLSAISGRSAFELAAMIAVFSVIEVAGVFVLGMQLFRRFEVALAAATVDALLPSGAMMVAWSAFGNLIALSLLPYALVAWLAYWEQPSVRSAAVAIVSVCGIAAIHHLSIAWLVATLALFSLLSVVGRPMETLRKLLPITVAGCLIGLPIVLRIVDLAGLFASGGQLEGLSRFDATRLNWSNWAQTASAFSIVFLSGGLGLFLGRDTPVAGRRLIAAYTGVSFFFAFGWLFGVDFYYVRAIYFLAIPSALGAASLLYIPAHPVVRLLTAVTVTAALGMSTLVESRLSTEWYQALSPRVIEATEWLHEASDPEDVVVVGTWLGYHMPGLLARPTMVALTPDLIGNPDDKKVADDAVSILNGLAGMDDALVRRDVKYVFVRNGQRDIPDATRSHAVMEAHPRLVLLFRNAEVSIYGVEPS